MNGARTIFRRKGYLLTALAAAVLLAASSGTAWAQEVTIDSVTLSGSSTTVVEGGRSDGRREIHGDGRSRCRCAGD